MKTKTKFNDQTAFLALAVASAAMVCLSVPTLLDLAAAHPAPATVSYLADIAAPRDATNAPRQKITTGTIAIRPTATPERVNF